MSKKTIKKLLLAGLIISVVSFIPFDFSHAQVLSGIAGNLAESFVWILGKALYLVGYAFSKLTYVGGLILNWALALNANIGDNPAAQIGWKITRDFTNLGFVLLIIIIAFSTILRIADFQAKKVLPKLIAAALLINFSIIIATFLLDGAGIFTNYFLQKGFLSGSSTNGNEVGISQAIAGTLSLGAILGSPSPEFSSSLLEWGPGIVKYITDIVFIDIMTAIGAITIWTMAFMFLVRYVYIGFLLILMPGAILMWVIGNKNWGDWLDKFVKYTFFGPIASFFVFLALSTSTKMEGLVLGKLINSDDVTGIATQFADKAASMIMMVFLLMGGLMAAESLSIMGAKTGVGYANGAMKFIGKTTGKLAAAPFKIAGTAAGTAAGMYGAEKAGKLGLSRIGRGTRFEGLLRPLRQLGANVEEYGKARGGIKDIPSAMFEEITGGYGAGNRKFRLQEQKQFKSEDKETTRLAKKMVYFDPTQAGNTDYMAQYAKDLTEAEASVTAELNKPGNDLKKVTEKFEKLSTLKALAKGAKVSEGEVNKFFTENGEDMDITKKYFEREGTVKNLMSLTLATRQQTEDALKKNLNDLKATKKTLEGLRKQNEQRIASEKQEVKEEMHKDYMENGFPRT